MTQRNTYRLSLLTGMACLFAVACTSAPVQEMSDARQAVAAARDAGAAKDSPTQFKAAEQYLQQAQDLLQHYRYREARKSAKLAKAQAVQARQEAVAHQHTE